MGVNVVFVRDVPNYIFAILFIYFMVYFTNLDTFTMFVYYLENALKWPKTVKID